MRHCIERHVVILFGCWVACQYFVLSAQPVPDGVKPWQGEVFRDLCSKYLEGAPSAAADAEERAAWRLGSTLGNVSGVGGVQGFYMSVNQWVSSRVGVYGRFAVANSGAGSLLLGPARQSYSGGLQWRFIDEADRVSAWGFGFSQAWGIEEEYALATERVIETYYRWQLADRFSLSPSFQLVLGSGGDPSGGTRLVFGVRTNFAH